LVFFAEANQHKKSEVPDSIFNMFEIVTEARATLTSLKAGTGRGGVVSQEDIADFLSGKSLGKKSKGKAAGRDEDLPSAADVERSGSGYKRGLIAHYDAIIKAIGGVGSTGWELVKKGCQNPLKSLFRYGNLFVLTKDRARSLKKGDVETVRVARVSVGCAPSPERLTFV
jgi:hypothetical protein